ncbi:tRNA guanosine(34) transglycosylase Tgt [Tsukamurella serpentis]
MTEPESEPVTARVATPAAELSELRAENAALAAELAELRTGYRAIAGHTRLRESGIVDPTRFTVDARGPRGARAGRLDTPHGEIATPAYLPVAGRGAIAGLTPSELRRLGTQALVVDLHELYLQPGTEVIEGAGGVGAAMAWAGPVFGDTGVSAIARQRRTRITDEGISFRGRLNGSPHLWQPEDVVRIAHRMDAGIAFAPADPSHPARTEHWARRALSEHAWQCADRRVARSLWGVVTGGADPRACERTARTLSRLSDDDRQQGGLGFGGYRIEVPSGAPITDAVAGAIAGLRDDAPRYLPQVGTTAELLAAVEAGVDLIDGVAAARLGAQGTVFTSEGMLDLTDPALRADFRPLDPAAPREGSPNRTDEFTRAYIHHLLAANEGLAVTLCTLHNEHFFAALAAGARRAIITGHYPEFAAAALARTR